MGSEDESKLTAPKLFGRRKGRSTPPPAEPVIGIEETVPLPPVVEEALEADDAAREAPPEPAVTPVTTQVATQEPPSAPPLETERRAERQRPSGRGVHLPVLSGMSASAVTGLLAGLFLVVATYGALHLCSSIRGASTCGGRAGFPLLLAIGILAVLGAGTLLRALGVSSPMGDSFLAIALVAVVTVLFLHNHYHAWWMLVAVPILTIVAFLLAHWVSVTYIDPLDE